MMPLERLAQGIEAPRFFGTRQKLPRLSRRGLGELAGGPIGAQGGGSPLRRAIPRSGSALALARISDETGSARPSAAWSILPKRAAKFEVWDRVGVRAASSRPADAGLGL